jgi:hypothetical protein
MVIAINTIGLVRNMNYEANVFFKELIAFIAVTQPNNRFVFIVNQPLTEELLLPQNCSCELVGTKPNNLLQLIIFNAFTLKSVVKKCKADVLLHMHSFCSKTINIPQIITIKNTDVVRSVFAKKIFKKSVQKATRILVNANDTKQSIITKHSNLNPLKFEIITGAANGNFKSMDYLAKVFVKDGYADGRDYFLAVADSYSFHEFITLLKAFSVFKRWQKSNMKLLLIGNILDYKQQLKEKFNTYKYRDDLLAISGISQLEKAKLMGAAYAVILPSIQPDFFLSVIQSLQISVPVIANNSEALQLQFADALLYVDMQNHDSIAEQMKLLYKDENFRTNLITNGISQIQGFNFTKSADALWQCIIIAQQVV